MLEWARAAGATHFVHASTGGIYGLGPAPLRDRRHQYCGAPRLLFSTKYAAEIIASAYRECLTIISLRYFFIYGVGQNSSMLLPRLIDAICNGHPLTIAGACGMRLNPIDVKDAAAATLAALTMDESKTINVAGPDVVSIRQLGEIIASEFGKPALFEQTLGAEGQDLVGDISLMSSCLGTPRIGIREGIERM